MSNSKSTVLTVKKVTPEDLSKANQLIFNEKQLAFLMGRTPKRFLKTRPAKGGGQWTYVSGAYITKVLNLMFGFDWSFSIKDFRYDLQIGQVFVEGCLSIPKGGGEYIVKEQFGRKDIVFKKGTRDPLDLGNDLKAASTDCLKKCASLIGIAADVYGKDDFVELDVVSEKQDPKAMAKEDRFYHFLDKAKDLLELDVLEVDFLDGSHTEKMEEAYKKKRELLSLTY